MRKQSSKEIVAEIKKFRKIHKIPQRTMKKHYKKFPFKKDIDSLLKEIPLKEVKKVRELYNKWCAEWINERAQLEQIYRAFYSSYKTRRSYWHFKTASILLLYLYGYISEKEITSVEKDEEGMEKVFKKHRKEMGKIQ